MVVSQCCKGAAVKYLWGGIYLRGGGGEIFWAGGGLKFYGALRGVDFFNASLANIFNKSKKGCFHEKQLNLGISNMRARVGLIFFLHVRGKVDFLWDVKGEGVYFYFMLPTKFSPPPPPI